MLNNYEKFLFEGKIIEKKFADDLIKNCGGTIIESSVKDDIKKHIDLWYVSSDNEKVSFDVKGLRKNKRNDKSFSFENTWLELKNVKGENGSLMGKQDYIAFEHIDKWYITRRKVIYEKICEKILDKTVYDYNPNQDYKLYQRKGRKDLIVRVPMSFIIENSCKIINKT